MGRHTIERDIESLKQAIAKGVKSLEELCRIGRFKTSEGLIDYCECNYIALPEDLIPYKTRPKIDSLIDKGLALEKIGEEVNLSRERVRQYIKSSWQYKTWIEKRKEITLSGKFSNKKELKELQGVFLSYVRGRTEELAEQEGFAAGKAVEYLHSYRNFHDKNYSFTFLYNLFKKYGKAKSGGVRLSLEEIGIEFGMHATRIGKIFSRISLEPMYGNCKMKVKKRDEKREAVKRGFSLEFSGRDIAYFLGLPERLPTGRYNSIGKRPKAQNYIAHIGISKGKYPLLLTYKLASQIYEAKDCNFNVEEIAELVKKDEVIVWYALDFRKEIEPKIIKGLRVLYKDPKGRFVKKPYLTKEMREIKLD